MTANIVIPGFEVIVPNTVWAAEPNRRGNARIIGITRTTPITVEDVVTAVASAAMAYANEKTITEEELRKDAFRKISALKLMAVMEESPFNHNYFMDYATRIPETERHLRGHAESVVTQINQFPELVYAETVTAKTTEIDGLRRLGEKSYLDAARAVIGTADEKKPLVTVMLPMHDGIRVCTTAELEQELRKKSKGTDLKGQRCYLRATNAGTEEAINFARLVHGAILAADNTAALTVNNDTKTCVASDKTLKEIICCDSMGILTETLQTIMQEAGLELQDRSGYRGSTVN